MFKYNVIRPEEMKLGDRAYLECDLPQRVEDFRPVTRIEREGQDYLFYQGSDSPFPYVVEPDTLVFTLLEVQHEHESSR